MRYGFGVLFICLRTVASFGDEGIDKAFNKKVLVALKERISIDKIEAFVMKKAVVNTTLDGHRDILDLASIAIDKKASQIDRLRDAKNVVYWVQTVEQNNRPVAIGIAWTDKNEMKYFTGTMFPP